MITEPLNPGQIATVQTLRCRACKWEAVFIMPEEWDRLFLATLDHLQTAHALPVPVFEVKSH